MSLESSNVSAQVDRPTSLALNITLSPPYPKPCQVTLHFLQASLFCSCTAWILLMIQSHGIQRTIMFEKVGLLIFCALGLAPQCEVSDEEASIQLT